MVTDIQKESILNRFCNLYEGKEEDIRSKPLVYGDLLLMAEEMDISVEEIASVLSAELDKVLRN